jgi:hypothetical protein
VEREKREKPIGAGRKIQRRKMTAMAHKEGQILKQGHKKGKRKGIGFRDTEEIKSAGLVTNRVFVEVRETQMKEEQNMTSKSLIYTNK